MTRHATIDFETYSEAGFEWDAANKKWTHPEGGSPANRGLTLVGVVNYTRHPTFAVLCAWYRLPGGDLTYWDPSMPPPQALFDHVAAGGTVEAHNHAFERRVFEALGWPAVPLAQQRCSMAKGRAWALPGSLGDASAVTGTRAKNPDGKTGIQRFCVPQKPTKANGQKTRLTREDRPDEFQRLIVDYCADDVRAEEAISEITPELSPIELEHWFVDQTINTRGVAVDVPTLQAMREVLRTAQKVYGDRCRAVTGGISPSEVSQLITWAAGHGVYFDALDDDALTEALERENLPQPVRAMLQCRAAVASASVKKVHAMLNRATTEGRIYDLFNFHAARTGRPTGDKVQPTNMPRGSSPVLRCPCGRWHYGETCPWCGAPKPDGKPDEWSPEAMHDAIEILQTGSLAMVERAYGDALTVMASCLRGMFVAAEGYDLVSSDYTAIEAVVLACLAGEKWRIDLFHAKGKIYEASGAKVGGVTYQSLIDYKKETGKHHPLRQVGKTCLSPDTQVLTDSGWVDIVDVSLNHRLWDGEEWVTHSGMVYQGRKQVMALDGVRMTPDHRISCAGSWKEARRLVSCESTLSLARETGSESLSSAALFSPKTGGWQASMCGATAEQRNTAWNLLIYAKGRARGAAGAPSEKVPSLEKCSGSMPISSQTTITEAAYSIGYPPRSLVAGRMVTPITGVAGSGSTNLGEKTDLSFCDTSSRCRDGIAPNSKWTESTATGTTRRETCGLSVGPKIASTSEECKKCRDGSTTWSDVYDIANAGPRTRFTIRTDCGAMVVHNCELALGFAGWIGAWLAFDSSGARSESELKDVILKWRDASPAIVEFWGGQVRRDGWNKRDELYGVEGHFIKAAMMPGTSVEYRGMIFESRIPDFPARCPTTALCAPVTVTITLLSGRKLTYHNVLLEPSDRPWGGRYAISYEGFNTNPKSGPRGWIRHRTHSGKLVENIVQATANDILRYALANLERAGYATVLHVYDEIVCEVPKGWGSVAELESIMADLPAWAKGWPIAADGGWRGKRYRKG